MGLETSKIGTTGRLGCGSQLKNTAFGADTPSEDLPEIKPIYVHELLHAQLSTAGISIPRFIRSLDQSYMSYVPLAPIYKGLDEDQMEDIELDLSIVRSEYRYFKS
jgi:hypothetical protein